MFARTFALPALLGLTVIGCASTRGAVVMRSDPTHAHVGLGKKDVAVDDTVRVYRLSCRVTPKRFQVCEKLTIAQGKVTELVGDDYAVVSFPPGTTIEEGHRVEKVR